MTDDAGTAQAAPAETPEERRERMRELGRRGGIARQAKAREEREAAAALAVAADAVTRGDEDAIRLRLRQIGLGQVKAGQVEVQALRALLGDDGDTDGFALPPTTFAGVREEWLALVLTAPDMDAAFALVAQHELAKRLTPEPEPASAQE